MARPKNKNKKTTNKGSRPNEVKNNPPPAKTRKTKQDSKVSFASMSHNVLYFWVGVQNFLLTGQLGPKKRAPPNHYKIGVSTIFWWGEKHASRNGDFGPKKQKSRNSSYYFLPIFLLSTTITQKSLKPVFLKCFSTPKKGIFKIQT